MDNFSEEQQAEIMRRINTVRAVEKKEPIPMGQGRPKRYRSIWNEDIINLKIALNTAKSFEEFLFII